MYEDLLQNMSHIEGLYLYGSGEMDQLSPIKEYIKEEKDSFESPIPRKIPLHFISKKETIKSIKCGAMTTYILSTEGNVYSFGCSDNGALGHEESISAKIIPLKFKAIGISGGDCHGIAYNRENLAFWGQFRNKNGKIGKAYTEPTYFNNKNINNEFYKKAISGTNHVLILTEKKNIFGFGNNEFGQLGVSPEKIFHHFQMNKFCEKNVEDISTGDEHSFLIKNENGRRILKSWGLNNNGQLGIGSFATNNEQNANIYVPTKVIFPGLFNISIKKVTGGSSTSLCLTEDNRVFVWGLNDFNLLGLKDKSKIIPSPKEIEFFNKYLNPNNEVDDIHASFQYFYANNKKTNNVYSWGSGDSFVLGNIKEKAETTPYLINYLFLKNLYVSDLALGCSHVAVLLIEKKDICKEENHNNEISKITNSKNNNKSRKRKNIENSSDKKEKVEDYGILVKVKEEYITLDKHDQPKLSVKKIKTEKKIILNKENNKKNIDKKEENEENKNKDNNKDKTKKELSKNSSSKKSINKKNEENCEKRENITEKEKEKNEDSNKKELKKNSIKKEKVDEKVEKKESDKKVKSNQKLIKNNSKYSNEKEEEDRMKKDKINSKSKRRNDSKKEEESEKRNQIKKNKKSKEDDKNENEKEIEDNEESLKKNKNKSKSKKNRNEKNENEYPSMKARRKSEEENKNKKSKSKSINNINIKNKSKSKEKKYPRK